MIAYVIAGGLLTAQDLDDDGVPLVKPISCCREGPEPLIINLPTLPEHAAKISELLQGAHADGFALSDVAVLCRGAKTRDMCARTRAQHGITMQHRISPGHYDPLANSINGMTMRVSKGLDFRCWRWRGWGRCMHRKRTRKPGCCVWRLLGQRRR